VFVAAILVTVVPQVRADSRSDAADVAQKYIDSYETIRTMEVEQMKRLIKAVCDADDDERKSVFRDEAERVASMVASEKDKLDKLKADANSKLEAAASDPQCEDKNKLSDLQNRVKELSDRIERIAEKGVHAASNPAFDKLRELGQMAHDDYYNHHSGCAPFRDIKVGDLKPDCILADECVVIELKPNSSRAGYNGWRQAKDARDRLNTDDGFDALDAKAKEALANCKGKFKARVDCYHYCPDVDDDGNVKSTSLDWFTRQQ